MGAPRHREDDEVSQVIRGDQTVSTQLHLLVTEDPELHHLPFPDPHPTRLGSQGKEGRSAHHPTSESTGRLYPKLPFFVFYITLYLMLNFLPLKMSLKRSRLWGGKKKDLGFVFCY